MEKLHHYTDSSGLLGILKGKSLWLSNIQFLNDNSEFIDGKKVIYEAIEDKIKHIKVNPVPTPSEFSLGEINQDAIIGYLNNLKMCLADSNQPNFDARNSLFIFSLSKSKNLLANGAPIVEMVAIQ